MQACVWPDWTASRKEGDSDQQNRQRKMRAQTFGMEEAATAHVSRNCTSCDDQTCIVSNGGSNARRRIAQRDAKVGLANPRSAQRAEEAGRLVARAVAARWAVATTGAGDPRARMEFDRVRRNGRRTPRCRLDHTLFSRDRGAPRGRRMVTAVADTRRQASVCLQSVVEAMLTTSGFCQRLVRVNVMRAAAHHRVHQDARRHQQRRGSVQGVTPDDILHAETAHRPLSHRGPFADGVRHGPVYDYLSIGRGVAVFGKSTSCHKAVGALAAGGINGIVRRLESLADRRLQTSRQQQPFQFAARRPQASQGIQVGQVRLKIRSLHGQKL